MIEKILGLITTALSKLGIEFAKYRQERAEETEREKALKAKLEIERESNEKSTADKLDYLRKRVRKPNN